MVKPRLKPYDILVRHRDLHLFQEPGIVTMLGDEDGQIRDLLTYLDGTRPLEEICAAFIKQWPELTAPDVAEGIAGLDQAGLLEDAAAATSLSPWQQERYASNLAFFGTFASFGQSRHAFQERLCRSRVVLLGVGGLGSTLLYSLAGLGVGHISVLDFDQVELKNLGRQFLYNEADVGASKVERAVARARAFNSEIQITAVERQVTGLADLADLVPGADLVLCGIDTPADAQRWVDEACVAAGVPWLSGGMWASRGCYYSVMPGQSGCWHCQREWRVREKQIEVPERRNNPVMNRGIGPAVSQIGSLIGMEALRYLTGFAAPVSAGRWWVMDFVTGEVKVGFEWPRLPDCPVCGRIGGTGT